MADDDENDAMMGNQPDKDTEEDKPKSCPDRYEGDKFIWTAEELRDKVKEFKKRKDEGDDDDEDVDQFEITAIKRDNDFTYTAGIRAHPFMDWKKSLWSILVPWHNEWINIWLYIGFAIYFWVEAFLIIFKDKKNYKFEKDRDYNLMFLVTIGIAISLTMTANFLIFYSVSKRVHDILDAFDFIGKLVMIYGFTFAFFYSEL